MDHLKGIRIFTEIADRGSMSAAAKSLGLANSVVSKHLTALEQWLGRKLVFRSTRHLCLTRDGLDYLPECRAILNAVEQLESRSRNGREVVEGKIKMTAPLYLGQRLLTPLVTDFCRKHPMVAIDLVLSDSHRSLVEEGFDIAFRVSEMPDSDLLSYRLRRVTLKTVATPGYIREQGVPLTPEELKRHRCITEGESTGRQRWLFRGKNDRHTSITLDGALSSSHGEAVMNFCEAGLGIAQLPGFFVDEAIDNGDLIELLTDYAVDTLYIHLLYHKHSTSHPAVAALIDHIKQRF